MDQNNQNTGLIHNSWTNWPTEILMSFVSTLNNLLQDAYIIIIFFFFFWKGVDNFEMEHKTG